MNKFWLFFGIFLTFTGFGTILGILIIVCLIWKEFNENDKNKNYLNKNSKFAGTYYNKKSLNDMK